MFGDTVTESSASSNHELELTFNDVMAQLMMPTARIVAWTVTSGGEIISDSLEITVNSSFTNKVNSLAHFTSSAMQPPSALLGMVAQWLAGSARNWKS